MKIIPHFLYTGTAIALLSILSWPAAADYYPLEQGNTWEHATDGGQVEVRVANGPTVIADNVVSVIEVTESPDNLGLENYWTTEDDGDVLLWGFDRGFGYIYLPPIKVLDAPLSVGHTWTSTFGLYALPDLDYLGDYEVTYTVYTEEELTVPAGVFPTFSIGTAEPGLRDFPCQGYSLSGERLAGRDGEPEYWYAWDVGWVQYEVAGLYRLVDYHVGTVGAESTSWSDLKVLFR